MRSKAPVLEILDHLVKGVADDLLDLGVVEKRLRPGVEPGHLQHGGVQFDGDDLLGGSGRLDGRVAQAGAGIQHAARSGARRCVLFSAYRGRGSMPLMRCMGMPEISRVGARSVGIRL